MPTQTLRLDADGPVEITLQDRDGSRPFLLLHGGGGPATMAGFADLLARRTGSRVLLPTHPGFAGTPKPDTLTTVPDLARAYVALLDRLDVREVTVVGNSFGGWVAVEIALLRSPRVSRVVIVDGVGVVVEGEAMTDVRGLTPTELRAHSFHDPGKAPVPHVPPGGADGAAPTGPSPDVLALIGYTGPAMSDPTLADRLAELDVPVHVLWGESDGIVTPAYGRAYAAAIPKATFTLLPATGHLPQVETPEQLLDAVLDLGA